MRPRMEKRRGGPSLWCFVPYGPAQLDRNWCANSFARYTGNRAADRQRPLGTSDGTKNSLNYKQRTKKSSLLSFSV